MTTETRNSSANGTRTLVAIIGTLVLLCLIALAMMSWSERSARHAQNRVRTEECLDEAVYGSRYAPSIETCIERAKAGAR